jgi:dihydroneopterin aldolase
LDIIFLHGLEAKCVIGVWEWEQRIEQTLRFDIDLGTNISVAAQSDKLDDTLNYKAVARRVIEFCEQSRFELIETLIEKVADVILSEFDVDWVKVRLDKGGVVKGVKNVGIVIERSKS